MFFRHVRPASQLLAAATDDAVADEVANALTKVVEDEQKQRDSEAQAKSSAANAGRPFWYGRPVMSDYCGLRESEGVYLIAEIKNADGECDDMKPGRPPRHACDGCVHRVGAPGWKRDRRLEDEYSRLTSEAAAAQASTQTPESLLQSTREASAARKAFEVAGAYSAKGMLATRPAYLDYCNKRSTEDEFAICVLQNPHRACPDWESVDDAPQPAEPAAVAPDAVLADGPPPLTGAMLAGLGEFLEWILQAPLPASVRELLQTALVARWRAGDVAAIARAQQWLATWTQVSAGDPAVRAYWRELNQAAFVDSLRSAGGELELALVSLYDTLNRAIAAGEPPLTAEAADASLDLFDFMASAVRGHDSLDVTPPARRAWRERLVALYSSLAPEEQSFFGHAPLTLAALHANWETLSEEQRAAYRRSWEPTLPGLAQLAASALTPTPPRSRPAGTAASPWDELDRIRLDQEARAEEIDRIDPQAAAQQRMFHTQMNAALLSNLARSEHEMVMGIIRTMRPS
jgi:hypothetical protein